MVLARTYKSKMWLFAGAAFVAFTAVGLINGRIVRLGPPGENFWLVFPAMLAFFVLAFAATIPWWRRLDDVQKSGHLVSWYWGGQIGAVIVLMALGAGTGVDSDYSRGGVAVFLGEGVAFLVAWLIWRYRMRGSPE